MMTVFDLNREQLAQLKQDYLLDNHPYVSWGELDDVDALVSDETVYNAFSGVEFSEDDFWTPEDTNVFANKNLAIA